MSTLAKEIHAYDTRHMSKETLALDIDDVVVKQVESFISWSNDTYGTNLTTADYSEAWHELWNIDLEQTEERKRAFFTDDIVGSFEVIEGAEIGLAALSGVRRIVGVTNRRESLRTITESALELIAPGAVAEVIFATYFRDGQKFTRPKAEICLEIGASDLVEDQVKQCIAANDVGVRAVLFGAYPWNQPYASLPDTILRARDWPAVLPHFGIDSSA